MTGEPIKNPGVLRHRGRARRRGASIQKRQAHESNAVDHTVFPNNNELIFARILP